MVRILNLGDYDRRKEGECPYCDGRNMNKTGDTEDDYPYSKITHKEVYAFLGVEIND